MVINTGKPDVKQDAPAHVPGIHQGNSVGNDEKQIGHLSGGRRTAASATGINPEKQGPIDDRMPNLPPA